METTPYERFNDMTFITNVLIQDELGNDLSDPANSDVPIDAAVRITYTYEINNTEQVIAGDTITFQLPNEISVANPGTYELRTQDAASILIATYSLATDGTIQFTFTDAIETGALSNVYGDFWFDLDFNSDALGLGGETPIIFTIGGTAVTHTIVVFFEELDPPAPTIEKSGALVSGSQRYIDWTIVLNDAEPDARSLATSVTDTLPSSLTFVDGYVTVNGSPADAADYTVVGQTFTYTFPAVVNGRQTITFRTMVTDEALSAGTEDANLAISNTSRLDHDGDFTFSNSASVNAPVDFIEKTSTYSQTNRRFYWTIWLNSNEVSIPDAVFTDLLPTTPALLTLDESTFLVDDTAIDSADLNYDTATNTVTYTFPTAITTRTKITFETTVADDYYDINQNRTFTNTAEITGTGVPSPAESTIAPSARSEAFNKYASGYDDATGTISWTIRINQNAQTLTNPIITDYIPNGQAYVIGSASINNGADNANFAYVEDTDPSNSYTGLLTYDFDPLSITDTINSQYDITFRTQVLDPDVYADNDTTTRYYNSARLIADEVDITDNASQVVNSNVITKTGTGYDYVTRELSWRIVVNRNEGPLENVVVTDLIPAGTEYVDGSFAITGGVSLDGLTLLTASEAGAGYSGGWSFDFDSTATDDVINQTYTITFRTRVTDLSIFATDGDVTFSNTSTLNHNDVPHDITSTGTRNVANDVVSKTFTYGAGDRFIEWAIAVNMNHIPLTDATITDVFQDGLELDTTSVKLYYMNVDSSGNTSRGTELTGLTSENVVYDIDSNTFEFHIPDPPVGQMIYGYELTFLTIVTQNNTTYDNTAYFNGTGVPSVDSITPLRIAWAGAGNSVYAENGTITVQKTDAKDNAPLNGAEFILRGPYGNIIERATTSGAGEVLFTDIRYDNTYTVQETSAPTGYLVNSTVHSILITNSNGVGPDVVLDYADERVKGDIVFYKTNLDGEGVPGATFSCTFEGGPYTTSTYNVGDVVSTEVSGADGRVVFEDLEYGNYSFREIIPPPGFLISSLVIYGSVTADGASTTTVPEAIADAQIIGSITIKKTDSRNGNPLADAEIGLYRLSDTGFSNPVAIGLSGVDGYVLFEDIPFGTYVIREIKAPDGFALSNERVQVSLATNGELADAGVLENTYDGTKTSPNTGDDMKGNIIMFFIALGLLVALLGAQGVLYYRWHHEKRMFRKLS